MNIDNPDFLAVLQQGGHGEAATVNQKNTFFSHNLFRLNWANDTTDKYANYIVTRPTYWTQGRQLLYELITRDYGEFEYYLFVDDDIEFIKTDVETRIVNYLKEWRPLCAAFSCFFGPHRHWSWDEENLAYKDDAPCCYMAHDENHTLIHKSVAKILFPLAFHGTGAFFRFIDLTIHAMYGGKKNIRFPAIKLINSGHRKRGVGHGPTNDILYNTMIDAMQPIYKIPLQYKKENKESIIKTNKKLLLKSPSNEICDVTTDIQHVLNVNSELWRNRKWILPEFKGDVINGFCSQK